MVEEFLVHRLFYRYLGYLWHCYLYRCYFQPRSFPRRCLGQEQGRPVLSYALDDDQFTFGDDPYASGDRTRGGDQHHTSYRHVPSVANVN